MWRDVQVTQRVYERALGELPEWDCPSCGFQNRPRPLMNSLGTVPADHPLNDPLWREAHCEQCGKERA